MDVMTRHKYFVAALLIGSTVPAAAATSPLQIASSVSVEQRSAATDGTVRVALVPAKRATPGDRIVFALDYRNTSKAPLADVVFDNPVPAGVAYRAVAAGSPEPLLSVDGKSFGPLNTLRVAGRPATIADITHVRWKLAAPIAPGASGRLAFAAVLK
jgi:uncharacterized repeat protein (TIGR01451 family)